MKQHICDQLQHALNEIRSEVRLEKDSNPIGEEIASARSINQRWVEIVREKDKDDFTFMVRIEGAFIGRVSMNDVAKAAQAIDEIISKNIAPEEIYTSNFGFSLPRGVSESLTGDQLLIKLIWLNIFHSYQHNNSHPPQMLEIAKALEASELATDLVPFISLGRLCFSKNFKDGVENVLCFSCRKNTGEAKTIRITSYDDIQFWIGDIEQLLEGFRSVLEKIESKKNSTRK